MSKPVKVIKRYDPASHEVADFSCGQESLDRWLHHYAGQSERRDATRTFAATDEHGAVRGYYTPWVLASSATERPSTSASTRYRAFATGDPPSFGVSYVSTQVSPMSWNRTPPGALFTGSTCGGGNGFV